MRHNFSGDRLPDLSELKMLYLFLLIATLFLVGCGESLPQNVEVSAAPIPTPTLTEFEKAKKAKEIEKSKEETKKSIAEESIFYGLSKLSEKILSGNDLEIRLWRFSAFGDRDLVFILTKTNQIWSARLIQRTIAQKIVYSNISNKRRFAKYSQGKLENPKSGWDSFWQKLTDTEILILPDGSEVGIEPFPDAGAFAIETKVDNKYRTYRYIDPDVFEEIREARQVVKIIYLISEEFNLLDEFESNNFMLP
jgi:hypothetical protein